MWRLMLLATIIGAVSGANLANAKKKPAQPPATKPKREPLTIRMLNPCALSYRYKTTDQKDPTSAFWDSVLSGIPAAAGDKDSRGNVVMKFAKWSDGLEACRRFQRGPYYGKLSINDAIRRWDGGPTWSDYAAYVKRRTGLDMKKRLIDLAREQHNKVIQAQAEWESGRVQPKQIQMVALTPPPPRPVRKP